MVEHESRPWLNEEFQSNAIWNLSNKMVQPPPMVVRRGTDIAYRLPPPPPPESMNPGERVRAPRCECMRCKNADTHEGASMSIIFSDYDSIDPKEVKELTEHQAFVSMSHMFGFILKERTYGECLKCINRVRRI